MYMYMYSVEQPSNSLTNYCSRNSCDIVVLYCSMCKSVNFSSMLILVDVYDSLLLCVHTHSRVMCMFDLVGYILAVCMWPYTVQNLQLSVLYYFLTEFEMPTVWFAVPRELYVYRAIHAFPNKMGVDQ